CSLRASIRRVEVQRLRLSDGILRSQPVAALICDQRLPREGSINLIGRCVEDERAMTAFARGLEYVQGAARVHLEIRSGIIDAGSHRDLSSEVIDLRRMADRALYQSVIANVSNGDLQPPRIFRR